MLRLALDQQQNMREVADVRADDIDDETNTGLSTLSMIGELARCLSDAETREAYDEAIIDLVEGNDREMNSAMETIVRQHGLNVVDRLTAEISWYNGIDVIAALAMAIMLEDKQGLATIEDVERDVILMICVWTPSDTPMSLNAAWLAPGIQWQPEGVVLEIPETLAIAAIGRPLSAIITHPVLDRHALIITGVSITNGRTMLETNADRTPVDVDALIAMRPQPKTKIKGDTDA